MCPVGALLIYGPVARFHLQILTIATWTLSLLPTRRRARPIFVAILMSFPAFTEYHGDNLDVYLDIKWIMVSVHWITQYFILTYPGEMESFIGLSVSRTLNQFEFHGKGTLVCLRYTLMFHLSLRRGERQGESLRQIEWHHWMNSVRLHSKMTSFKKHLMVRDQSEMRRLKKRLN